MINIQKIKHDGELSAIRAVMISKLDYIAECVKPTKSETVHGLPQWLEEIRFALVDLKELYAEWVKIDGEGNDD